MLPEDPTSFEVVYQNGVAKVVTPFTIRIIPPVAWVDVGIVACISSRCHGFVGHAAVGVTVFRM